MKKEKREKLMFSPVRSTEPSSTKDTHPYPPAKGLHHKISELTGKQNKQNKTIPIFPNRKLTYKQLILPTANNATEL